ncbi:MAG: hypothetical protein RLZZ433_753 [Pseudomonadota bacterium]
MTQARKIAVIGAGWAGLAAAITAVQAGHQVTLFEASRHWGGRARSLPLTHNGRSTSLDNGQHILIGAYQQTLALMQTVGVDLEVALWRMPLNLKDPQGQGLSLPSLPFPFNLLWGIARAKGWRNADKWSLLKTAVRWQGMQFMCDDTATVQDICQGLSPRIWQDLIEPLCVSALNTPAHQASGRVFLRVLKDAVFGPPGSADLLLPRQDLGALFPQAAVTWLEAHGAICKLGHRIESLNANDAQTTTWHISDSKFDHVIVATPAWEASHLLAPIDPDWAKTASALMHEAIATVYVQAPEHFKLPQPMLSLQSNATAPAQFVFDRGQMMLTQNTPGLMAFVISASQDGKATLERKIIQQAQDLFRTLRFEVQGAEDFSIVQTVIEKRATFACVPQLARPNGKPSKGVSVCGDYVAGAYPATLEGAVLSGCEAGRRAAGIEV